jgi:LysM repeat protein
VGLRETISKKDLKQTYFDFPRLMRIIPFGPMKYNPPYQVLWRMPQFLFLLLPAILGAQSYNDPDTRVQIANLTQDVRILSQKVGQLQVRIEQLERENEGLRKQAVDRKTLEQELAGFEAALQSGLSGLRVDYANADEAQKQAIIKAVSGQISDVVGQMNETIEALADYVGHRGTGVPAVEFSDDYPRTGFRYEVKPGDSLAKIAEQHGVNIRDIINANRITDPDKIQVGQNLFIPKNRE